jgi:diacylglycerol kinase
MNNKIMWKMTLCLIALTIAILCLLPFEWNSFTRELFAQYSVIGSAIFTCVIIATLNTAIEIGKEQAQYEYFVISNRSKEE